MFIHISEANKSVHCMFGITVDRPNQGGTATLLKLENCSFCKITVACHDSAKLTCESKHAPTRDCIFPSRENGSRVFGFTFNLDALEVFFKVPEAILTLKLCLA